MDTTFTKERHISSARKEHRCDWCRSAIACGEPYVRYRMFEGPAHVSTVRLHPECWHAATVYYWDYGTEFPDCANPRGCRCGWGELGIAGRCEECEAPDDVVAEAWQAARD